MDRFNCTLAQDNIMQVRDAFRAALAGMLYTVVYSNQFFRYKLEIDAAVHLGGRRSVYEIGSAEHVHVVDNQLIIHDSKGTVAWSTIYPTEAGMSVAALDEEAHFSFEPGNGTDEKPDMIRVTWLNNRQDRLTINMVYVITGKMKAAKHA